MLMGVLEKCRYASAYPELAGKRVLITGVSGGCGVDIVRAFADHKTRLILQFAEWSEPAQAIAEIAAPAALEIRSFGPLERSADAASKFARTAVQAFGGLDVVVNLVSLSLAHLPKSATLGDIEHRVAERLRLPFLIGKIAANRMGLAHIEGMVVNVANLAPRQSPCLPFAGLVKSALAEITRAQAKEWASQAVRCNAIAPATLAQEEPNFASEPDIAALLLYLASEAGKGLSGHVFEPEPARGAPLLPIGSRDC